MTTSDKSHRDTLFLEEAAILSHQAFADGQHLLRLQAPECAGRAKPGNFVHLQCDPLRPLRRPISLMRASAEEGWVELLYKVVGEGTALLAGRRPGETVSLLGPIGTPFQLYDDRPRPLLIGGGVGMPPMLFLAEATRESAIHKPLAILGSESPFPFPTTSSALAVAGMPAEATATLELLEDWDVPARLTSLRGFNGCFNGFVTDLARHWLDALSAKERMEVAIYACGPHPMLEAVAALARDYGLPCQVSLEEFMACGVGGCAGCVVPVTDQSGTGMKRVCVDGPVFDAAQIFPA
jgi:dihydroorotate dehydrogenase electron transfer subunit